MSPVDRIEQEAARIVEVSRDADLAAPVPALGRWKIRDVVAHLGGVHRWADRIVTSRSMDGPGFTKSKLDGDELLDWFDEGASALASTLRAIDPAEPCPNFNPGSNKTVGWWITRQLQETTVHRWDVESGCGDPGPIDAEVASEGVGEFLDTFVRSRGKQTATGPVVLRAGDTGASWTITLAAKPGRVDVTEGAAPDVDTVVTAAAADLLLALWNRQPLDADIAGDRATALAFLGGA